MNNSATHIGVILLLRVESDPAALWKSMQGEIYRFKIALVSQS